MDQEFNQHSKAINAKKESYLYLYLKETNNHYLNKNVLKIKTKLSLDLIPFANKIIYRLILIIIEK